MALAGGDGCDFAMDLVADGGGADVDVEAGQQVERSGGAGGVAEGTGFEVERGGRWSGRAVGGEGEAGRKDGGEISEALTGARGDDEGREEGKLGAAMPMMEGEERIGSHEKEECCGGRELGFEGKQCVVGVVGRAGLIGRVDEGEREGGIAGDGEARHGDTVVEAGGRAARLERLGSDGGEEDLVEGERGLRGAGDGEMAAMGRIEGATEEGDARAGGGHESMVKLRDRGAEQGLGTGAMDRDQGQGDRLQ